jgi:hypothetical protein
VLLQTVVLTCSVLVLLRQDFLALGAGQHAVALRTPDLSIGWMRFQLALMPLVQGLSLTQPAVLGQPSAAQLQIRRTGQDPLDAAQ